ncbi:MAG: hypothetical protein KAX26_13455, partial [Anaerolineae bacterium]|nr:hypothetical protein [Anaerolineae bacterium]
RPDWPVVVVARSFRADDLSRLTAQLRRVHSPYQLLWDDVHEKPALFADAVLRLAEMGDPSTGLRVGMRVLAAYREQYTAAVWERVRPGLCRRAGIQPHPLQLVPFDAGQAAQMAQAVTEPLGLALDEAAHRAFARHIRRGDGGPLFALSTGLLLQGRAAQGEPVRAADVARLPDDLLETWRYLYERLAERPNGLCPQNLLGVLHFLHQVACPLNARLAELLFTHVLGHSRGEFDGAVRTLARGGWMRREEDGFVVHDVTLEAVPEDPDRFRRFAHFAREGVAGEELALGLLRDAVGRFFYERIAFAEYKDERQHAAETAVSFGVQAIESFRAVHSPAYLAMSLNNASVFYSDLAGLEETGAG